MLPACFVTYCFSIPRFFRADVNSLPKDSDHADLRFLLAEGEAGIKMAALQYRQSPGSVYHLEYKTQAHPLLMHGMVSRWCLHGNTHVAVWASQGYTVACDPRAQYSEVQRITLSPEETKMS